MNFINLLVKLLAKAYDRESAKQSVEADKLYSASNTARDNAIELAAAAQTEQEQSYELRAQAVSAEVRATAIAERGRAVAAFFSAEIK